MNLKLRCLRNWHDSLIFLLQFDKPVAFQCLERARQIARLAVCGFRQVLHRFRFRVCNHMQQVPIFITQYFRHRLHRCKPDFGLAFFWLIVAFGDRQHSLTDFFLRHNTDHDFVHLGWPGILAFLTLCHVICFTDVRPVEAHKSAHILLLIPNRPVGGHP